MPDPTTDFLGFLRPTPQKPLLGQTVLAVEDSRCAGEALRLLALRSGARFRRADSLRAAARHLRTYRPTVVICDLGLPDGSGLTLLEELARARARVAGLIAISGDPALEARALEAGATAFLAKPVASVGAFQTVVLSALPPGEGPAGPRVLCAEAVLPDPDSVTDDLAHVADLLSSSEADGTADYIAGFVAGIGRVAGDPQLVATADRLARSVRGNEPFGRPLADLSGLVQARLVHRSAGARGPK
jgi:CheY-like chemotaxis protein